MRRDELPALLQDWNAFPDVTAQEVERHFAEKYETIRYHGRDVYLFSQNRAFGARKHIVSIHGSNSPRTPEHIYQYVLVTYCYAGTFRMQIDGVPTILEAGDCIVADSHVPHSVSETDGNTFAVNIVLNDRFFQQKMIPDVYRLDADFPVELADPGTPHTGWRFYETRGNEFVRTCIDYILCEHFDEKPGSSDMIDDLAAAMLTGIFRTFEERDEGFEEQLNQSELMGEIRQYIGDNYQDGNLGRMAEALGYEASYLSTFIRRSTGRTFKQLVNEERMRHATIFLQSDATPISQIARKVGMSNLTQFYKRFAEYAGCTPKEYRDRCSMAG